jgi:hypothetical protein
MFVNWTWSSTLTRQVCIHIWSLQCSHSHHILAEVVQGGLVLETNVDEIDTAGETLGRATELDAKLLVSAISHESAYHIFRICKSACIR